MPPSGQDGAQPGAEPPGGGADGRDTSTGDAGELADGGNTPGDAGGGADGSDAASAGAGGLPGTPGGGDYSLDTLPSGGVFQGSQGTGQPGGAMTAAERAAILDGQLSRTYEVYDEILRQEQADARGAANRAGSSGAGGDESQAGGGQGGSQQQGGAMPGGLPNGPGGADIAGAPGMPGAPPGGGNEQETFPPPEDIPGGRDDDVVARQLREAAMTEPDPELREALWDEYRNYTGIAVDQ